MFLIESQLPKGLMPFPVRVRYSVSERVARSIAVTLAGMPKAQHAPRYRYLPALLRRLREEAGLTQRALAEKLNVTHVWVHKSEISERRVDITEFIDWCAACGVDPGKAFAELRRHRGI